MENSLKKRKTMYWKEKTHSQKQSLTHAGYLADGRTNMATTQDLMRQTMAWHSRLRAMRKRKEIRRKTSRVTNVENPDTTPMNVTKKSR